jgi:hypothetical protein
LTTGVLRVLAGLAFTALSATTGLLGVDVAHFWLALILLGMGWNFGFVRWCNRSMTLSCSGQWPSARSFRVIC